MFVQKQIWKIDVSDTDKILREKIQEKEFLRNKPCLKKEVYDICALPVVTYELEEMALTKISTNKHRIMSAIEHTMLCLSLRDKMKNE